MELKDRKRILNTLPSFNLGTEAAMATVNSKDTFGLLSGGNVALFDQMANLKLENSMLKSGQFTPTKDGKLEAKVSAQGGKTGAFLKNNAGNIANAAMSAINFASTIGGLSKNTMSSDEMMGSGGTTQESANGIGYTQQRVDEAGILKQIDATASAATMTGALSGAALGGSIGTIFGPLGTGIGTLAGGLLGGVAGLIGGNKAKEEAERQKRIAINRTNAANALNREQAYTIGLRNEFNRENRTDMSLSLFHAEEGIEGAINPITRETYKKHIVNTKYGKIKTNQNAWVSDEEVIGNKNDGYLYKVQGGKNDTARAYLEPGDSVYSKKVINPETGNPVADDAPVYAAMGMLDRLDMNLNIGRMMEYAGRRKGNVLPGYIGGTNKYKCLPGFKYGLPDTYLSTITGVGDSVMGMPPETDVVGDKNITDIWNKEADTLANNWYLPTNTNNIPKPAPVIASRPQVTTNPTTTTNTGTPRSKTPGFWSKLWGGIKNAGRGLDLGNITQLANAYSIAAQRDARAEGLRAPKSFVANPYEQDALQQLNSLHSDYYPVWSQHREAEARGWNAARNSGGLSAGQLAAVGMGLTNQTQQNMQQALFEHQGRENTLRAQAANAALQAGQNAATRQQQAYQWDEDMLARAHAAQDEKLEMSAKDRQGALGSFFKNMWEKDLFDQNMNLLRDDQKIEKGKIQAMIDNMNKPQVSAAAPEVKKPAETATDAAAKAQQGSPEAPKIDMPEKEPMFNGNILSRRRKSSGEDVKTLQRNLAKALGQDKINEIMKRRGVKTWDDGKFGGATEEALMAFLESQGWKTRKDGKDGIFGGNSFKALMKAVKGK